MLKWFVASLFVHALLVACYMTCIQLARHSTWTNDPSKPSELPLGVVSVDYMPIVQKPVSQTRTQAPTATATQQKAKAVDTVGASVANQSAPSSASSNVVAANTVSLIGEAGAPSLTLEQYVRWVRSHNVSVEYPRMARIRGDQGRVVVEVTVPARGTPLESAVVVSSSGSSLLDEASLETAKKWTYPPFQGPERVTISIAFKFVLEE